MIRHARVELGAPWTFPAATFGLIAAALCVGVRGGLDAVDRALAAEEAAAAADAVETQGRHDRWWQMSSFDLLRGLDVSEAPMDTLPGDLVDDFLSIDLSRLRTQVRSGR